MLHFNLYFNCSVFASKDWLHWNMSGAYTLVSCLLEGVLGKRIKTWQANLLVLSLLPNVWSSGTIWADCTFYIFSILYYILYNLCKGLKTWTYLSHFSFYFLHVYFGLILLVALKLVWSWRVIVDFCCPSLLEWLTLLQHINLYFYWPEFRNFILHLGSNLYISMALWDSLINILE